MSTVCSREKNFSSQRVLCQQSVIVFSRTGQPLTQPEGKADDVGVGQDDADNGKCCRAGLKHARRKTASISE